ncbi:hypothetical protein AALP_AA5G201500 [Arabis alpina]|uniref:F-box domain-containing protein n=1 Tax=Arabis alpina TaxID=50452 RepID=A0A087GYA0_ARAAL|nr:hypothetical protein AALP_AA5G201500 [Arabis alpina]
MSGRIHPSAAANGPEPPSEKPSIEPTSILSLPDDLIVSCFARVSRLYYPTLSLVSKRFRSLLASPDIYHARSLLGRTESCLYVGLRSPPHHNLRWFTLCQKPDQSLTKKKEKVKSSGNVLAPVSVLGSPSVKWSDLFTVGPYLYAIPEPIEHGNVSVLDCRTHTWSDKPKELIGEVVGLDTSFDLQCPGACRVEDIIYYYNCSTDTIWTNNKTLCWRELEVLEGLPKFARYTSVKMAEYRGKLVILWDKYVSKNGYKEKVIWCAQIALKRGIGKVIRGEVEWLDAVLTVPKSCKLVCAIAATV